MRTAFITAEGDRIRYEDVDRPLHEESFARAGMQLEYRFWTDPSVDWASYDLVVIRSPWDYPERPGEFMAFLDQIGDLRTLHNPAGLIRWNIDKSYLLEMARCGVPIVHTVIADDVDEVAVALANIPGEDAVVKPVVSAGSRLTGWFSKRDPAALDLAREILGEGGRVIVEPAIRSVGEVGEVSVVTFDGEVSHCLRKGPILARGGGLIGGSYTEVITPHEPSPDELSVAGTAQQAATRIAIDRGWLPRGSRLLYGRFDVVELDDGTSALIEAELFEPSLFLEVSDGSADRFTNACRRLAASRAEFPSCGRSSR